MSEKNTPSLGSALCSERVAVGGCLEEVVGHETLPFFRKSYCTLEVFIKFCEAALTFLYGCQLNQDTRKFQ